MLIRTHAQGRLSFFAAHVIAGLILRLEGRARCDLARVMRLVTMRPGEDSVVAGRGFGCAVYVDAPV